MDHEAPFTGSAGVYDYISRFINLERGQTARTFRLDRMTALAAAAGRPERGAPVIHVAGSKGKGSVTGMAAAMLQAAGVVTARYGSPHVSDFRERVCLAGGFFDEEVYARAGDELRAAVRAAGSGPDAALFAGADEPTFFELMTLWFFLCARRAGAGAMAVEVGMGGRLDATNIVTPRVAVITPIELEHTEYLGTTLGAIAGEKAGIIKPGRPVAVAEQDPEALAVFQARARALGCPLLYLPERAGLRNLRVSVDGTAFDLDLPDRSLDGLRLSIPGEIQAKNAALAALAVLTAFPDLPDAALRRGLASFTLPARFERLRADPVVVIDGAHTARSVRECVRVFTALYGEGGALVFGCATGKDARSMAEILHDRFARVVVTTPGAFKKSSPEEVHGIFRAVRAGSGAVDRGGGIVLIPDPARALEAALDTGLPTLAVGSFYLAAEIREYAAKHSWRYV